MKNYDPFWTEKTTKTTTTTTTEPSNMKTNNDHTFFIFAFMVVMIVIFISLTAEIYYKDQKETEFAKAGLIQKVQDGHVIWTKP